MRPPVFLILLVLLAGSAAATLQLNPNTIGEMKATAQLHATVDINGNTTAQDRLEIRMLTFSDDEHQHTTDRSDKLVIKDKTLEPTYETKNNSRYALYTVSNLAQYGQEFRIDIYSNATIETTTSFLLNTDYNLATPITENTEFLKPSAYIETDDPALIAKTNIQFQSDSQLETIRQITDWMHDNITYDFENYYNGVWSAKQTYENRAGVCDEFANLSAAFLRIKGIPTRYVAGISFDGTRFGNHGWLESFLPGTGWIPIDTTYGEAGYLDAMHIAVGKANDTNNLQNLAITTTSSHALTVSAILQDPYIDTNNLTYQTIQKLTQIRIQTPGKIGSRQPFQIKTVLTNQTNHPLIVPLELSLHPDFEYTHKTKQILLAANGQTAIDWNAVSPANAQLGYLTTYELRLSAPDQTVDANLVIDPRYDNPLAVQAPTIQLVDVSPYVRDNTLSVQLTIQSNDANPRTLILQLTQNEHSAQQTKTVLPNQSTTIQIELALIAPGTAVLDLNGALQKTIRFEIPATPQQSVQTIETDQPSTGPDQGAPTNNQTGSQGNPPVAHDFLSDLFAQIAAFFKSLFGGQ